MNYTAEIIASLATAGAYCALFAVVELWSRRRSPDVELTRKAVHFGGGMIALAFPLVFGSPITVAILALLFSGLLILTRRLGILGSVQGVERITIGEIIYPIAIASTLFLSTISGGPLLYWIPLLILAVSDAAAGIIGKGYGRHRYRISGETKSVEGSLAFYISSFLIILAGLAISGDLGLPAMLLIAHITSLLLTAVEAVSPNGIDNLAVPIAAWGLLALLIRHTVGGLIAESAVPTLVAVGALLRALRPGSRPGSGVDAGRARS
jgi:dolichol kinase